MVNPRSPRRGMGNFLGSMNTAQRDQLPTEKLRSGNWIFNRDTGMPEVYDGSGWGSFAEGGEAWSTYPDLELIDIIDVASEFGINRIYYQTIDHFPGGFDIGSLGTAYEWVMIAATASGGPMGIFGTNDLDGSWTYIGLLVGVQPTAYHHIVLDVGAGNTPNGKRFMMYAWLGNPNIGLPNWGVQYESDDLLNWSNEVFFTIPDPGLVGGPVPYTAGICWGLSYGAYKAGAGNAGIGVDYTLVGWGVVQFAAGGNETCAFWTADNLDLSVATFTWRPVPCFPQYDIPNPTGQSFSVHRSWIRVSYVRPGLYIGVINTGTTGSSQGLTLLATGYPREADELTRSGLSQFGHTTLGIEGSIGALDGVVPTRVGPAEVAVKEGYANLFVTWRGDIGSGNNYYLIHARFPV